MKSLLSPPILKGYVYTYQEAVQSRNKGEILSIRLETSRICNLKCSYCCNQSGKAVENEIPFQKLLSLVDEAYALGAKSIVVIGGGEPTIYQHFRELIEYIDHLGLIPVIFTNTQTMDKDLAHFLYNHNVSVIVKLDSLSKKLQDSLVGVRGAYERIQSGIKNLLDAGYSNTHKDELRLGASFVVSNLNYTEVEDIWRFCRQNNIFPNLEMMIPNGNASEMEEQIVSATDWGHLKRKLLQIDQKEFGYNWFPYTPIVGVGCFQVMYNLYITVKGEVRPCSSIHCHAASVYDYSLKEIINLPFFVKARHIEQHLQGKCGECNKHQVCIGCRGLAYSTNKSCKPEIDALCSSDPSCNYTKENYEWV